MKKKPWVCHCSCDDRSWDGLTHDTQCQAEQNLINAAPDLLQALKDVVLFEGSATALRNARAVINKIKENQYATA